MPPAWLARLPEQGNNMSYILEALKKAQAERQLGASPTIHTPGLQVAAAGASAGGLKKPVLMIGLAMVVVIAVLLVLVLRPASTPAASPALEQQVAAQPPQAMPPAVAAVPASPPAVAVPPQQPVAALAPVAATKTASASKPAAVPVMAAAPAVVESPARPAAVTAQEDPVQNLRDLPEPIQRSIPQIAVGGYIYSKNPADRLLLIDKILRHEGEEVAPGLVLEKLQPREAVFNYKGYRYRQPY